MNCENFVFDTESNQSCVELEKQIYQEIEDSRVTLKKLRSIPQYTEEMIAQIHATENSIRNNKYLLQELQSMHLLKTGNWVQNGASKPGEIVELGVCDRRPQVKVRWWQQEKIESQSPTNLKVLSDRDLQFEWHEKKLVRRCDRFECNDLETLKTYSEKADQDLKRAELGGQPVAYLDGYKQQITYCQKRIKLLSGKQTAKIPEFDSGIKSSQEQTILRLFGSQKEEDTSSGVSSNISAVREKKLQTLPITDIRRNPVCQQREELDLKVVEDYKEAFLQNIKLPPVKVKFDGSNYWLYDGFHTTEAAIQAKLTELQVEVTTGTLRDAILASLGVNADHGLRRSNQTKRNAVMVLLQDREWRNWSNREIAKQCKVSEGLVRLTKKELENASITEEGNKIITAYIRSDNLKDDNTIISGVNSSDNLKNYKDKYGNISKMNVDDIGVSLNDRAPVKFQSNPELPRTTGHTETATKVKFLPNQLLKLQLTDIKDAPSSLKALNHSYCVIDRESEVGNSYYVKFLESSEIYLVMASDLVAVESVQITINYTPTEYLNALNCYGTRDFLESAIKKITRTRCLRSPQTFQPSVQECKS
jgi:hypothetical protein